MIDWTWKKSEVSAADILIGANTLMPLKCMEVDLTNDWTPAEDYLAWAREGLSHQNACGWDIAVCYAKRAACRRIDEFMMQNHLRYCDHISYPKKISTLNELGIDIPDIVQDLVIDPRNDIEHKYSRADHVLAKRAVELAGMLLRATDQKAINKTAVLLGFPPDYHSQSSVMSGPENNFIKFRLEHHHSPMLFVDVAPIEPIVMILNPKGEEMKYCPLKSFKRPEVIEFAQMLNLSHGAASRHTLNRAEIEKIHSDLKLETRIL